LKDAIPKLTNLMESDQYNITKGTLKAKGNELGVFEDLNDHFVTGDLDLYWLNLYPDIPAGTYPTEELIDGATGAALQYQEAGIESNLDFMAAIPLVYPQKTKVFQTDDEYYEILQDDPTETTYPGFWNTFYDALDGSYCSFSAYGETGDCVDAACRDPGYPDKYGYGGALQCGVYKPTNVISISYGGGEDDLPGYYLKRQCAEIMKLGLQGITVVLASGDSGVGDPEFCLGTEQAIFEPVDDASCPYVLAVGSTEFDNTTAANGINDKLFEMSTTQFGSGGGFSNVFAAPTYQTAAVNNYLSTTGPSLGFSGYTNASFEAVGGDFSRIPPGQLFNLDGRAYPDVSAIGENFLIFFRSQLGSIGGTSLAAPVWAAILNRINEERIAVGKSTIGFVNPTLVCALLVS
jgi:tripeptidyl-peptidase I